MGVWQAQPAYEGLCRAGWGIGASLARGRPTLTSPMWGRSSSGLWVWADGCQSGHHGGVKSLAAYFRVLWDARTWRAYTYLLLGLLFGILWGTYAITMYAVGVALVIIWVGIPILVFTQMSMRWIGASERGLANVLLDAKIDRPARMRPRPGAAAATNTWMRSVHWSGAHMHDAHAWRVAAWVGARLVLGPVGFAVALVGVVVPISILAAIVQAATFALGWGDWMTDAESADVVNVVSFWVLVGSPVLILAAPLFAWASRGVAAAHVPLARWALGSCESERVRRATERAERAEERVRIDQELHDSIGHMITMTIVQAGAGAHVFDSDPDFARQALKNIEQRGRAAMGELDRIIATIRGDDAEARTPLPGIDDLAALVDGSRAAGMTIDAVLEPPTVAPAVGRAAFGVVREALTNAAKHAPGAPVSVQVQRDSDALAIRVVNAKGAPSEPVPTGQHGVAGMRDRIGLLGGASQIGPTDGGGYEVLALIPLGASLAATSEPPTQWSHLRETVSA